MPVTSVTEIGARPMLHQHQQLELAELIHKGMRSRPPASAIELGQAEDTALYVTDWFMSKARWTSPDTDTVTLTVDEVRMVQESLVAARQMMFTATSITTDDEMGEILAGARDLLGDVVRLLASTPPRSFTEELVVPPVNTASEGRVA